MTAKAETCIKALRALAQDIQSEDGVANAALSECADRMERMDRDIQRWHDALTPLMPSDFKSWHENNPSEWPEVTAWVITSQRDRIKRLEEATFWNRNKHKKKGAK